METEHSKVKRVFAFAAAVLVFAAAVYFAVYLITYDSPPKSVLSGNDAYIEQLQKGGYRLPMEMTSTAQSGSSGQAKNSLLSLKSGINSGADYVQLNISFTADGTAVLADSFDEITTNSVPLTVAIETVLDSESNSEVKMIFNIKEASHVETLQELFAQYSLYDRVVVTGLNRTNYDHVITYIMEVPYLLDISSEDAQSTDSLLEQLSFAEEISAIGINVDIDDIDADKVNAVREAYSLMIFACNADSADELYKAVGLSVDNIGTVCPKELERYFVALK